MQQETRMALKPTWVTQSVDSDFKILRPSSQRLVYPACTVFTRKCPFFCPRESVHWHPKCICDLVIADYEVCEGGKHVFCTHAKIGKESIQTKTPMCTVTCRLRTKLLDVGLINPAGKWISTCFDKLKSFLMLFCLGNKPVKIKTICLPIKTFDSYISLLYTYWEILTKKLCRKFSYAN